MTWAKRVVLFLATNLAVLLVLGLVLNLLGLGGIAYQRYGINYPQLLAFAAVFGFGGALISLALSKTIAKWTTRAKVITEPRSEAEVWLVSTVERLARDAGIGMPEVAVYDAPDPNAFATGARRNHALIAVSTGLLRSMRRDEIAAVLAHEVSHVANGDMVTLTLIQGVVNTFVIFFARIIGNLVDKVLFRSESDRPGPAYWIATIVSELVLGILASLLVMWFSRWREFRADAGSAKLNGTQPMISALDRLRMAQGHPPMLPESIRAFGIRGGPAWTKLFRSHPPLEERIAALQQQPVR